MSDTNTPSTPSLALARRISAFANHDPWTLDRMHRLLQYGLRTLSIHLTQLDTALSPSPTPSLSPSATLSSSPSSTLQPISSSLQPISSTLQPISSSLRPIAQALAAFSSQLSAARTINRLYGTIDYTLGVVDALRPLRLQPLLLNLTLLLYAVAELLYLVALLAPRLMPRALSADLCSYWSCRGWLAYLLLERYAITSAAWAAKSAAQSTLSTSSTSSTLSTSSTSSDAHIAWVRRQEDLYNWCNLPLAAAWSFENGCHIPTPVVYWAGFIGSLIGFRKSWVSMFRKV